MMHAVDPERRRSDKAAESGTRRHGDLVGEMIPGEARGGEIVVLDRAAELGADVLVKRSAQCHVDDLEPSAKPEERLALGDGPSGELKLHPVTSRVQPAAIGPAGLAIRGRIQVDAAWQQQAVEPLVKRAERVLVIEQRNHDRQPTGASDYPGVALVHHPRFRQRLGDSLDGMQGLSWDSDDRPMRHVVSS